MNAVLQCFEWQELEAAEGHFGLAVGTPGANREVKRGGTRVCVVDVVRGDAEDDGGGDGLPCAAQHGADNGVPPKEARWLGARADVLTAVCAV